MQAFRNILFGLVIFAAGQSVMATELVWVHDRPANARLIERLAGAPLPLQSKADSVVTILQVHGYLDGRVTARGDSLLVQSGRRFLLDRIIVTGDSSIELSADGFFTARNVKEHLDKLIDQQVEKGFYYANLQVTEVVEKNNSILIHASLNRGPVVTVAKVRFEGLKRSNPELLRKLLPVNSGDTLTGELIRQIENEAQQMEHLVFIPPVKIKPRSGYTGAELVLEFVEKKQLQVEGSGGYIPRESVGLVWSLRAAFTSLFGEGRRAELFTERVEYGRNILDLSYHQPMTLAGQGRLGVRVTTRDYRDRFYEFSAGADYFAQLSTGWAAGLGITYRAVTPENDLPSFISYTAELSSRQRTMYPRYNPRTGWLLDWSVSYTHRKYHQDSLTPGIERPILNDQRAVIDIQNIQPLFGRFIVRTGLSYRGYFTAEALPPVSELYLIGGPPSLRGYRNENFPAVHAVTGTVEPRFRFADGYLYLFYDGAYLNNRSAADSIVSTEEIYRNGFGCGLAVAQPGRSVRLSLGWNPDLAFDQPRLSIEFSADI